MSLDLDALSFTELVRLRDDLSSTLHRRFGRELALVFTDVVGSTEHFARFGDVAGRALQQRHFDHLAAAIAPRGGRVVDTAGDGAFTVFASVDDALRAVLALQEGILAGNQGRDRDQRLKVRVGVHWSTVLTDGEVVSGDGVNLCARVSAAADPGGVLITRAGHDALASDLRSRCHSARDLQPKGIPYAIQVLSVEWLDASRFPTHVEIVEAGRRLRLPDQEVISFGRLGSLDGQSANDVVLSLADELALQRVSRWHFELHRHADGFWVRPVSAQGVEVDDIHVAKGEERLLGPSSVLRLGGVMTLKFRREPRVGALGQGGATMSQALGEDLLPPRTIRTVR